ncbi:MAG: BTAD domain-containing putative transcriptional regulator, partial [Gemmatimonadota bacterium]
HARASLRQALYYLGRSLGSEAFTKRGNDEVALDPDVVRCDAVAFEDALDGGEVEEALELYRGDLLEGFFLSGCPGFERWLEVERERLRERAAGAASRLAHRELAEGRITAGERLGQRALGYACTDENEVRRFIAALAGAGDRAAAVRFYERFAQELEEALELEPSAETRRLVEGIREGRLPRPPRSRSAPDAQSGPPDPGEPLATGRAVASLRFGLAGLPQRTFQEGERRPAHDLHGALSGQPREVDQGHQSLYPHRDRDGVHEALELERRQSVA